jgi:hypothetical protein
VSSEFDELDRASDVARHRRENDDFERLVRQKRSAMRAYVARNNGCLPQSVMMIGPDVDGAWMRALVCDLGNHAQRARNFMLRYNAAPAVDAEC